MVTFNERMRRKLQERGEEFVKNRKIENYNLRIGKLSSLVAPHYSECKICKTNWLFVKNKTVTYFVGEGYSVGHFALCEKCFYELTPQERLPYYLEAMKSRQVFNPDTEWLTDEEIIRIQVKNMTRAILEEESDGK